ncbi:MAG: phosphoribosylglycinamide formyltransferase, partial [Pseudomonadota bacterium]|nr:phosphoribosylglycinamide formyltransferase [Pseudomonadota bacterium]
MAERARVAILISGRGSNMAALIYAAKAEDCAFEVVLVTGDRPDAPGLTLAEAEGVRVARLGYAHKAELFEQLDEALREARADYVALAGFMRIIPADFIGRWAGRIVNVHPSLLPKYKGLDTHALAVAAGDRQAGCSVHVVTAEVDDGPVLGQTEVAILPGDSPETLAERVLIAEHQLYPRVLAEYVGREQSLEWITARVGELAQDLPETHARTSHGSPGWRVGSQAAGKFFAIMFNRHHGEDSIGLLVKCTGQDEMAQLIDADPDIYFRPAYYGPSDWVGIRLDRHGVDWDHVAQRLATSWRIVAPPRLTKLL